MDEKDKLSVFIPFMLRLYLLQRIATQIPYNRGSKGSSKFALAVVFLPKYNIFHPDD